MFLTRHQPLDGVVLTSCGWESLQPIPNLSTNPTIEYFEIGHGRREFCDEFLRGIGMTANMTGYNANLLESSSPKEDRFFRQARIWFENGRNEDQTKPLGDFIWDFMDSEQAWLREQGGSMMKKVYGEEYIYTSFWLNFGLMRESGIKMFGDQGPWAYTEWRIWSYPHLTSA